MITKLPSSSIVRLLQFCRGQTYEVINWLSGILIFKFNCFAIYFWYIFILSSLVELLEYIKDSAVFVWLPINLYCVRETCIAATSKLNEFSIYRTPVTVSYSSLKNMSAKAYFAIYIEVWHKVKWLFDSATLLSPKDTDKDPWFEIVPTTKFYGLWSSRTYTL